MTIYAIVLNEPDEAAWERVKSGWPDRHYIVTGHLAFVAPEEVILTEGITEELGMDDEGNVTGVVIEAASYSGFNKPGLWEWARKFS